MTAGRLAGLVLALLLLAAGAFLTLAGNGVIGSSGDTSHGWATIGPGALGFGVALVYVVLAKRH